MKPLSKASGLMVILCALTCLQGVHALQLSPATHEYISHENTQTYSITITNDEALPLMLRLSAVGEFAAYIGIPASLNLQPGESKSVEIIIQPTPQALPGIHESGVLVESIASGSETVSASSALKHLIRTNVPNEGKHVEAKLLHSSGSSGDKRLMTVSLKNVGTQKIDEIYANIGISGPQPFNITTDRASVLAGQTQDLIVPWTPAKEGVYNFEVTAFYDGKSLEFISNSSVGRPRLLINTINIGEFSLRNPFKIEIEIENDWNEPVALSLQSTIEQNSLTKQTSTTGSVLLQPYQKKKIPVYMESNNLVLGEAEIIVTAAYGDTLISKKQPVVLAESKLSKKLVQSGKVQWFIVGVLCLILALLWIWMRKPRKRKIGGDYG